MAFVTSLDWYLRTTILKSGILCRWMRCLHKTVQLLNAGPTPGHCNFQNGGPPPLPQIVASMPRKILESPGPKVQWGTLLQAIHLVDHGLTKYLARLLRMSCLPRKVIYVSILMVKVYGTRSYGLDGYIYMQSPFECRCVLTCVPRMWLSEKWRRVLFDEVLHSGTYKFRVPGCTSFDQIRARRCCSDQLVIFCIKTPLFL